MGFIGRGRLHRMLRQTALGLPLVLLLGVLGTTPAQAWKPYTHEVGGDRVWTQVTASGRVTITTGTGANQHTHSYPVDSRIVSALRNWKAYYNAGVIGPDGFPDITYGQAVIHPEHTGQWMRYIYQQAWQAQNDPQYSADERAQILAFAYGFMIHGAGDMWGHTLINSFAGGVFPSVQNMVSDLVTKGDPTRFLIGLRHIVSEGYVGNATPGWDSFEGDDVPDPTTPCISVNAGPPDAICTTASDTTLEELSQVCDAQTMNNPPAGTTCEVTAQFNQLVPDISENSTLGIPLQAPTKFIYNTLIDPNAPTPLSVCGNGGTAPGCPNGPYLLRNGASAFALERGPAIDFFLDLEAKLQVATARYRDDANFHNCSEGLSANGACAPVQVTLAPINTVRGIDSTEVVTHVACVSGVSGCFPDLTDTGIIDGLTADYLDAWIADIGAGLRHFADFSLGIARGLFDPQTRRDAENDACRTTGSEDIFNLQRDNCEKAVSLGDAVFFGVDHVYEGQSDPSWINQFLIPMVGFPDFVGDIRNLGHQIADIIDSIFQFLGIFNPLDAILADLHEYVISTVENYINQAYGIDIPKFEEFFRSPSQWFCGDDGSGKSITILGHTFTPSGMFSTAQHARMDGFMSVPADHHAVAAGIPGDCAPLKDSAKFDEAKFAAYADSVTMSKLLLLDGKQLDSVVGDALVDAGVIKSAGAVQTYGQGVNYDSTSNGGNYPANVMVDTLESNGQATATPSSWDVWLQLIDGDHAWRRDGLPLFCNAPLGMTCATPAEMSNYQVKPFIRDLTNPDLADMMINGGNGHFPIWASCLMRPAFRGIFQDWENADNTQTTTQFPDLGDGAVGDASVTAAASSSVAFTGTTYSAAGIQYIAGDNLFTLQATDVIFQPSVLGVEYRAFKDGSTAPAYTASTLGGTFGIAANAGDGLWEVNSLASNPCKAFGSAAPTAAQYFLDTTPPNIVISQPAASAYTHSQVLTLAYTVDDGNGSGVKSFTPTLDGSTTVAGHGLQSGQAINLLTELGLGTHTFRVAATDNVNNSDANQVTFTIIVTAQSIKDDVTQFFSAGSVKNAGEENSLLTKLDAAAKRRAVGDCAGAASIYQAFINELTAQSGTGVDSIAAATMIGDAQYLIAHCP